MLPATRTGPYLFSPPLRENQGTLPAWPLVTYLYGFPLIWLLGASQFAPSLLAVSMLLLMLTRRQILTHPVHWIWLALIIWALVCTVSLTSPGNYLGWFQRFMNLANAGVFALYYFNARQRISLPLLLGGLITVWLTLLVLGHLALLFPEARLTTPMSLILPAGLQANEWVRDAVRPPLAEVQWPWGAEQAYIRPAAPFPYANSWGLAYALLTPVLLSCYFLLTSKGVKLLLTLALLASLSPALATSNRGMLLGLGLSLTYLALRLFLASAWRPLAYLLALATGLVTYLVTSGAIEKILGRQEFSDSTGGRAELYRLTLDYALRSPLVGYGTSRPAPSIGVSLGTQGYVWALLFCFGFVGLGLFLCYLLYSLLATWQLKTGAGFCLHSLLFSSLLMVFFYSYDLMQLTSLLLVVSALLRAKYNPQEANL